MTTPAPRFRGARRLSLAATAALALVTACESQLPTAAEVERMDVAALEARTAVGVPGTAGVTTRYFLNGRELTEAEVKALPAARIATIGVRNGANQVREVRITTGDSLRVVRGMALNGRQLDSGAVTMVRVAEGLPDSFMVKGMPLDTALLRLERNDASTGGRGLATATVELRRRGGTDSSVAVVIGSGGTVVQGTKLEGAAQPLLIVDGVRQPQEALKRLSPDAIQSIEVIKGAAASKVYGADGANGVIVVTTKGKK